jgi:hypothetical protein
MSNSDAHNATNPVVCSTKCLSTAPWYNMGGFTRWTWVWLISLFSPGTHWMVDITLRPIYPWHSLDWEIDVTVTSSRETAPTPLRQGGRVVPRTSLYVEGEKKIRHRDISSSCAKYIENVTICVCCNIFLTVYLYRWLHKNENTREAVNSISSK